MSTASSNVPRGWFGEARRERRRIEAEMAAETARFEAHKEQEVRLPVRVPPPVRASRAPAELPKPGVRTMGLLESDDLR